MKRLEEIKERLEKATPGPWKLDCGELKRDVPESELARYYGDNLLLSANQLGSSAYVRRPEDADFIAHSRSDIEFLLTQLREAEQARDDWKAYALAREHDRDYWKKRWESAMVDLNQTMAKLEAVAARLKEGWVSVEERLPKVGQIVWIYGGPARRRSDGMWESLLEGRFVINWRVTYWLPYSALPSPPESVGVKKGD